MGLLSGGAREDVAVACGAVAANDEAAAYAFSLLPRRFRGLDEPYFLVRAFGGFVFRPHGRDGPGDGLEATPGRGGSGPPHILSSLVGRSSPTDNDVVVACRHGRIHGRFLRCFFTVTKKVDFVLGVAALSERVARRYQRGPV
jgi:hypothetical protein